jgi:hypothetical protein
MAAATAKDKRWQTPTSATTSPSIRRSGLAAGACSGNGILLDIKDPVHPKRVDAVNDPNYSYWHSATFSNDGTKVVFTDEWGGGMQPRCRPTDPIKWGADAIFTLKDDHLSLASYYKMPAAQKPPKTASRTTVRSSQSPGAMSRCRPGTRAASR